jgi:hypothetical protein
VHLQIDNTERAIPPRHQQLGFEEVTRHAVFPGSPLTPAKAFSSGFRVAPSACPVAFSAAVHSRHERVQMPLADSPQLLAAPVIEGHPRSGNDVLDSARHEYLSSLCERRDARRRMNGDADRLAVDDLALAGVEAGTHIQAESMDDLDDLPRTADSAGRPVEPSKEAVPGSIEFLPAVTNERCTNKFVMPREQLTPLSVAELRRTRGRTHDVREHQRCEPRGCGQSPPNRRSAHRPETA